MLERINYRLNLIAHGWSGLVVAMARSRHRLNASAMKILTVIARYQPISPGELVTRTATDSPKVARAVGALTGQGLIQRIPDPHDGRRALLSVTAEGARVAADIDRFAQRVETQLLAALTATERSHLNRILDKLEAAIRQPQRTRSLR